MDLFERPGAGERAVLVHVEFQDEAAREESGEFKELVAASGAIAVAMAGGRRSAPDPRYFVGTGKAEEIRSLAETANADLVIFNHALSPSQQRNLEQLCQRRVLDRTGLILDIFAQRARTFEGKLQVELAQLGYLSTRLVRGWTHLERQKGGIGLRGPGETQLETDRRLIGQRIKQLNKRLEKVRRQRDDRRRVRRKSSVHSVSLVGYTNAGKSTLFNALTAAGVYAEDKLFATLDPTLRQLDVATQSDAVLVDTVGFIRHLPHSLIAAFRSTLEETREATLLLHVVDAHDEHRHMRMIEVNHVLKEVGAHEQPQLEVFNKLDLVENRAPCIERDAAGRPARVWVSAKTGAGLDLLKQAVTEYLQAEEAQARGEPVVFGRLIEPQHYRVCIASRAGRLRAALYTDHMVVSETIAENGDWLLELKLRPRQLDELIAQDGCRLVADHVLDPVASF